MAQGTVQTRTDHRWSDEGAEAGEIPMWPGSGMEKEWRADAHQCDHAWSTAHKRPTSEKARPRARCRASPMASSQCAAATGEALGHPRRWRHQRRSARLNCWRAGCSSPMNSRPKDELERTVTKIDDVKDRGRPSPKHQTLAWREQRKST